MKRDREVCPNTGFGQNQMASSLATGQLTCFFKSLHCFFAGDVAELSMAEPRYIYVGENYCPVSEVPLRNSRTTKADSSTHHPRTEKRSGPRSLRMTAAVLL